MNLSSFVDDTAVASPNLVIEMVFVVAYFFGVGMQVGSGQVLILL